MNLCPNQYYHWKTFSSTPEISRIPRIVAFNRLEARPRTLDFTRSLRAEVRDPLWMLTRQWQFGEFKGEDAASAVTSRIAYQHETIDHVAFREEDAFVFDPTTMPLETRVERERIPLTVRETTDGEVFSDLLFAVQWGKQFLRMLKDGGLEGHYGLYLGAFPLRVLPPDPPPPVGQGSPAPPPHPVQDPDAEQVEAVGGRTHCRRRGHLAGRGGRDARSRGWIPGPGGDKAALKMVAADFAESCSQKIQAAVHATG